MTPLSCWLLDDGDSRLCRHRDGHLCHSSEARRPFLGSNHRLHLSHRRWPLHDGEFDPTYFYVWNCLLTGFGVVAGFCVCVCVFVFVLCRLLLLLPPWLCHWGSDLIAPLLTLGTVREAGRADVGYPLLLSYLCTSFCQSTCSVCLWNDVFLVFSFCFLVHVFLWHL